MSSGRPLFSIVIPVYNDREGLRRCLEAIKAQNLESVGIELVVADNNSTEQIEDIVKDYPFARYVSEPKIGSYNARNTACKVAQGEFLAFTDADCIPKPDWIENALKFFQSNPGTAAIGGRIEMGLSTDPSAAELYEKVFMFRQDKFIYENGFAVTANLLVRRQWFDNVGPFDGSLRSGGDRNWGHRLYDAGGRLSFAENVSVVHPARASLSELIRKRRRVEGGRRVVPPLATTSKHWVPDSTRYPIRGWRMGYALMFHPGRLGLRQPEGLQVLAVVVMLALAGWMERLRIRLGGEPLR